MNVLADEGTILEAAVEKQYSQGEIFNHYVPFEIEKAEGKLIVKGYVTSGARTHDGQRVVAGAFADSIEAYMANPISLYNHNMDWPVGSSIKCIEDEKGLYAEVEVIDPQIQQWILEGRIRAFSWAGRVAAEEIRPEEDPAFKGVDTRFITKAILMDISVVTIPNDPEALFEISKAHLSQEVSGEFSLWLPFNKADDDKMMVFGYASVAEVVDEQGHIMDLGALVKAVPEYAKYRNIREMHKNVAVGTAPVIKVDGKGLWIGAKISEGAMDAWHKIKDQTYKGFSIGGFAKQTRKEERNGRTYLRITDLELEEISICDRPINRQAVYQLVKCHQGGSSMGETAETQVEQVSPDEKHKGFIGSMLKLVGGYLGGDEAELEIAKAGKKLSSKNLSLFKEKLAAIESSVSDIKEFLSTLSDEETAELDAEMKAKSKAPCDDDDDEKMDKADKAKAKSAASKKDGAMEKNAADVTEDTSVETVQKSETTPIEVAFKFPPALVACIKQKVQAGMSSSDAAKECWAEYAKSEKSAAELEEIFSPDNMKDIVPAEVVTTVSTSDEVKPKAMVTAADFIEALNKSEIASTIEEIKKSQAALDERVSEIEKIRPIRKSGDAPRSSGSSEDDDPFGTVFSGLGSGRARLEGD